MRLLLIGSLTALIWFLVALQLQAFTEAVHQAITDLNIQQRVTQTHMLDMELRLRGLEK